MVSFGLGLFSEELEKRICEVGERQCDGLEGGWEWLFSGLSFG